MRRSGLLALCAAVALLSPAAEAQRPIATPTPAPTKAPPKKGRAGARPEAKPGRTPAPLPPEPTPTPSAVLQGERITLAAAIQRTLENSPDIARARLEVDRQRGVLQSAAGAFDTLVTFQPSFSRDSSHLTATRLKAEVSRRDQLRQVTQQLSALADGIARGLTSQKEEDFVLPDCRGNQYFVNGFNICSNTTRSSASRGFELLPGSQKGGSTFSSINLLQRGFEKQGRQLLTSILFIIQRGFLPSFSTQLTSLGGLPSVTETDTLTLDLRAPMTFRDGIVVSPIIFTQGSRTAFAGKADNPLFGGQFTPSLYRGALGISADVPLGRASGRDSVDAQERVAKLDFEAAQETLAQTASDSVLNTILSYWNLAAQQELLTLLEKSAASDLRIREIAHALIEADEVARAEGSYVEARVADSEAASAAARQGVVTARVDLARAMGITITDLSMAPLAADPLPDGAGANRLAEAEIKALGDLAVQRRGDVLAARLREKSAYVFVKASKIELRPQLDVSLQAAYNAIYEDPTFQVTRVFDFRGYGRAWAGGAPPPTGVAYGASAVGGAWRGPSVLLSFNFQVPIHNNAARGRLVQSESLHSQSVIFERDLERQVRNRVADSLLAARRAAEEVEARRAATEKYEEILHSSTDRFRAGEISLLDVILTERSVTQSVSDLIAAQQTFAQRLSRLRHETGALLRHTRKNGEVSLSPAEPLGFEIN